MPGKKPNKLRNYLKTLLYILVVLTPALSYFIFILNKTHFPMLDTDGYNYIWFWNVLASGKILPMQTTVPKPLMVFFYGMLATPGLHIIEALKLLIITATGYGIFKLSYRLTEDYTLSYLAELIVFLLPMTLQNMGLGNSTFMVAPFLIWAVYMYIEERYYLAAFLLLIGGLIRPDAWGISILLILHYLIAEHKFNFALLIGIIAPFLWMTFDFFLTKDPFYSFKVMKYYMTISGFQVLKASMLPVKWKEAFLHFIGTYGSILLILAFLFSFLKRKRETLLISFVALTLFAQLTVSVLRGGLFMDRFAYITGIMLLMLVPFFLQSIFSFTFEWIAPFVLAVSVIFIFLGLKPMLYNVQNIFMSEKLKQETCREMAPQVSVIDDKRVLMPARRIGMFAFLNHKAYTDNIIDERRFVANNMRLSDIDYIVFIFRDFVGRASYIFSPLYQKDLLKTGNIVIQKLYTTPNGFGKIFKVFVLAETPQDQKAQEQSP